VFGMYGDRLGNRCTRVLRSTNQRRRNERAHPNDLRHWNSHRRVAVLSHRCVTERHCYFVRVRQSTNDYPARAAHYVPHGRLTSGAFNALGPVPVAAMGGTQDLGRRIGTVNTVLGFGSLCGPPLGGLLTSTSLGYKGVGYFAGERGVRLGCILDANPRPFA
jgi:hypothetical protein